MSPVDVAELVAQSREAQGLPRHVEDPGAMARIAALLAPKPLQTTEAPKRWRRPVGIVAKRGAVANGQDAESESASTGFLAVAEAVDGANLEPGPAVEP